MSYLDDPRVYFAAERTLLAWVRTGLTIMGLGFVVAKFGLFLRYLALATPGHAEAAQSRLSLIVGLALVLIGSAACWASAVQFNRFVRTLSAEELPPRWSPSLSGLIAHGLALAGLGLGLYLLIG